MRLIVFPCSILSRKIWIWQWVNPNLDPRLRLRRSFENLFPFIKWEMTWDLSECHDNPVTQLLDYVAWAVPGHWAAWYSSQCEATGLWRWTPEWTAWCAHGHSRSGTCRGSGVPLPWFPALSYHSPPRRRRRHCAGCPNSWRCPVSEDCSPRCCRRHLGGNSQYNCWLEPAFCIPDGEKRQKLCYQ